VVAAITAYNYPLLLTSYKVAGGLAAGCTAVLMPSPRAALHGIAFMRMCQEAGIPDGAVNLVIGEAAGGRQLCEHDGVDMVSFTGSREIGSVVMQQAARGVKKTVLELGGKSPNILLPGTDVDSVIQPSVLRFCRNAGQGCGATTRTLVPREEYDHYVAATRRFMSTIRVGDPFDEATDVGPLIRGEQRERVEGFVQRAIDGGAVVEAGGGRPDGLERGFYMNPALVGNVDNGMEICREELFGPVGALLPYDSVDDAVRIANDSIYGLNANIWGPPDQAIAVARKLRTGTVTVNGGGGDRPDAPWGGFRQSGVGAERGEDGFAEFFQTKHIQWPLGAVGKPAGVR
jgi:aldehyde dehydrogenase (NAD+)/betaine-aldehyde dehydrogenase